ncbi:glycosyltransferase family 2 protein [Planctomycetota bacterium]
MKLIIQIPCYNEADQLAATLDELPRAIEGIDTIEVLIVDDGSRDETVRVARARGVDHVVHFAANRGLARAFNAGLDACLRLGAGVIVNTDADNQYHGADIVKLVRPILSGEADIVVGDRQTARLKHFSLMKRVLQRLGSAVVRRAGGIAVADAPSGFRAYSRQAALRTVAITDYSYTLETLISAGHQRLSVVSVPIAVRSVERPSRLISSIPLYVRRSAATIIRTYSSYRALDLFTRIGLVLLLAGAALGGRFLYFYFQGHGSGRIQSLILMAILVLMGFQTLLSGILADQISLNRRLLDEIIYRTRRVEFGETSIPYMDEAGRSAATEPDDQAGNLSQ